jgi:hypothetical protein
LEARFLFCGFLVDLARFDFAGRDLRRLRLGGRILLVAA